MHIYNKIINYINKGQRRSVLAKKNIIGSFFNKGIAIVISLLIIPITIDYLEPEQYGIWLTISSMIMWISYFDIGLVHGFKNKFAEAIANNNNLLAREYVSTTFFIMACIFIPIMIIAELINPHIIWSSILNISPQYNPTLVKVSAILIFFICIQLILGVTPAMLMASQRPAFASFITTIGQGIALICIYMLTLLPSKEMTYISFALAGVPCIVLLFFSILLFSKNYKKYRPSIKYIRINLINNIINLGVKFFIISISMLFIFQAVNIILSRTQGPNAVTTFNVTYKYFSIIQMAFIIILSPFWAAFTDAYTKKDYEWMKRVYHKLNKTFYFFIILPIIQLIISPFIYKIWLPSTVFTSVTISFFMCLYILMLTYSNLNMTLINGTGKVYIQTIVYAFWGIISVPLLYRGSKEIGIVGVLIILTLVYAVLALFGHIQIKKIIDCKDCGIWSK